MPSHVEHMNAVMDAFNDGDTSRFVELLEGATYSEPATGRSASGADLKALMDGYRAAFPDQEGTVSTAVEGSDVVAGEVRFTGTHSGPMRLADGREVAPTGNTVEQVGVMVGHYENGTLARLTYYFDALSLWRQIGVV